jgi:hypothetical protein
MTEPCITAAAAVPAHLEAILRTRVTSATLEVPLLPDGGLGSDGALCH